LHTSSGLEPKVKPAVVIVVLNRVEAALLTIEVTIAGFQLRVAGGNKYQLSFQGKQL